MQLDTFSFSFFALRIMLKFFSSVEMVNTHVEDCVVGNSARKRTVQFYGDDFDEARLHCNVCLEMAKNSGLTVFTY